MGIQTEFLIKSIQIETQNLKEEITKLQKEVLELKETVDLLVREEKEDLDFTEPKENNFSVL